ncbi:MAG: hypothetical protein EOM73_13395, partial [Bacteroidia bacterium]|nr:hypothetical protein [Bacteroidia bacterium]
GVLAAGITVLTVKLLRPRLGHVLKNRAKISSGFAMRKHPVTGEYKMHAAVDIAIPTGTPIQSPASGVVTETYNGSDTRGKGLRINHGAYDTLYYHCSAVNVTKGEKVRRGQLIALSGNTGMSTGAHLHYAVYDNRLKQWIDPARFSLFKNNSLASLEGFNSYQQKWYETNAPTGRALGYPECCIREFGNDAPEILKTRKPTEADKMRYQAGCINGVFTGFIPCKKHAEQILAGQISLQSLIKNRRHDLPQFPKA